MSNLVFCNRCGIEKDAALYSKNKNSSNGLASWCKACYKVANRKYYLENTAKVKDASRRWMDSNPEKFAHSVWANKLVKKYGISVSDYEQMLSRQDGACAVCKITSPGGLKGTHFHVDHCHRSNKVRGLLCLGCNNGGKLTDDPDLLAAKLLYLIEAGDVLSSTSLTRLIEVVQS